MVTKSTKKRARKKTKSATQRRPRTAKSPHGAKSTKTRLVEFDWSYLAAPERHGAFERMAGDLVSLVFDASLYTPNATRAGKDGGADGLYVGKIGGVAGPWKIASATRKDLPSPETKIRAENKLAKKKAFKALLFITPFDLTPTDVKRLALLAGKGLKKGIVWGRGKLDQLLRKYPWVATYYLGHQLIPGFVPADYPGEKDIVGQVDIPLVGRESECAAIEAFFSSSEKILVVVAPGGSGKSRLLRELSVVAHRKAPRRSVWLRRIGQGTIEESIQNGLPISSPLVICLDDAGRALGEVRELARLAADTRPTLNVKLALAVREADRAAVLEALGNSRSGARTIDLAELTPVARFAIVKKDCPQLSKKDSERLAHAFGRNLFLLRAAVQCILDGQSPSQVVNIEDLRDLVAGRLVKEATALLSSVAPQGRSPEQLLLELSLDVPVSRDCASDIMVATLKEAGVLREVGNTLRFRSDVEGDVLLGHLLRKAWARAYVQASLGNDVRQIPSRVRNLAAAGSADPSTIVRGLCRDWLAHFGTLTSQERAQVLEALPHCVSSALDEVRDLGRKFVEISEATTDELGPILLGVSRLHGPARAMAFARQLGYGAVKEGIYSNYKLGEADGLIVDLNSARLDDVVGACDLVMEWIGTALDDIEAKACAQLIRAGRVPVRVEIEDGAFSRVFSRPGTTPGSTGGMRPWRNVPGTCVS